MSRHTQKGSAHVVVVIILVLSLIGALGYIFWQNLNKNEVENKKTTTSQPTQALKLLTVSFNEGFGFKLSMNYPENWVLEKSITGSFPINLENGATRETIKITSPTKKYSVEYTVSSNAGIGGMCFPEDTGVIKQINSEPAALDGMRFAEVISTNKEGKYHFYSGLMKQEVATETVVNESVCDLMYAGIADLHNLPDGTPITLFEATVHIDGFNDPTNISDDKVSETTSEIEEAFKTKEYDQAKAILISTTRS